jgi:hypothetical protein
MRVNSKIREAAARYFSVNFFCQLVNLRNDRHPPVRYILRTFFHKTNLQTQLESNWLDSGAAGSEATDFADRPFRQQVGFSVVPLESFKSFRIGGRLIRRHAAGLDHARRSLRLR